ncbi:MAG TPA: thermonuclease family protein [Pyrinomonadaceae bacterium]|nr:thermonuclease family protein [Pyrinomonadaceae bacterium]
MKAPHVTRVLLTLCALCSVAAVAQAATLQAKVTDVPSGNTIVVSNINRPLKVRLKGIAPPEVGQRFADAAREHLKSLVFDKAVFVEYTDLSDGYLEARVTLNGVDVASQMIRDGVAWYDRNDNYALIEADQNLYSQCEELARSEKRGLWSEANPITPWAFRKAQQEKLARIERPAATVTGRTAPAASLRPQRSLSNTDLFGNIFGGNSSSATPNVRPVDEHGTPDRWIRIDSAREHFSISVPSNSVEGSFAGEDEQKQPTSFHFLMGGSAEAIVTFLAATGPQVALADATFSDQMMQGLIAGMNQGASEHGESDRVITLKASRTITLAGLSGREYILHSAAFGGTARVLTRKVGDAQEVFVMMALTRAGSEPLGSRFINSFKLQ